MRTRSKTFALSMFFYSSMYNNCYIITMNMIVLQVFTFISLYWQYVNLLLKNVIKLNCSYQTSISIFIWDLFLLNLPSKNLHLVHSYPFSRQHVAWLDCQNDAHSVLMKQQLKLSPTTISWFIKHFTWSTQTRQVLLRSSATLGRLLMIRLRLEIRPGFPNRAWHCAMVEVRRVASDGATEAQSEVQTFLCDRWLLPEDGAIELRSDKCTLGILDLALRD